MKRRFRPAASILAIEPSALSLWWEPPAPPTNETRDGVAIVTVRGPLDHHDGGWCDSYEAIAARVAVAIEAKPKAVILALDSPGGLATGNIEAATAIRELCAAAGVPLKAFVDGRAASAAYALACVAAEIVVAPSSFVGSIGTMAEIVDFSALDAAMGVKVHLFASGARKLDGNPHAPMDDAAKAAISAHIATLAASFVAHVAEHRPVSAAEVQALEAGLFIGAEAVEVGLADRVGTLASLISGEPPKSSAPAGAGKGKTMDDDEKKARAALQAIIDDEKASAKAKSRAKAALAAMDAEGDDDDQEDDGGENGDKSDDDAENMSALAVANRALAMVEADRRTKAVSDLLATRPDLSTEQRAFAVTLEPKACASYLATIPKAADQRAKAVSDLLATRPDLTPEQKSFAETLEPEACAKFLATIPRGKRNPAASIAPGTLPTDTRRDPSGHAGGTLQNPHFQQSPEAVEKMRIGMGLSTEKRGVSIDGGVLTLGGVVKPG